MPEPLLTQTVIAFVWDFDHTLIAGNMQAEIFAAYDVDPGEFWDEVDALAGYHAARGEIVAEDMAYLLHLITYVRAGKLPGLSNDRLRELGRSLRPVPGMPDFLPATQARIAAVPEFRREGITVEHYVVSTGIRPMIEGSPFAAHLDGIWANTFVEAPAPPGFLGDEAPTSTAAGITQVGVAIGDTGKTRAIFEINKGVNADPALDVHEPLPESHRRVPLRNMIYVADGASDVPVFSILNAGGGTTFGVAVDDDIAVDRVTALADQGRIQGMAAADFRAGQPAHDWLMERMEQIGYEIVEERRQALAPVPGMDR